MIFVEIYKDSEGMTIGICASGTFQCYLFGVRVCFEQTQKYCTQYQIFLPLYFTKSQNKSSRNKSRMIKFKYK